jgi:hypothetical protein
VDAGWARDHDRRPVATAEDALAGKTMIDCGNAVDVSDFSLVT